MSPHGYRRLAVLTLLSATACTITRHIEPVPARTIAAVCIVENEKVFGKDFLAAVREGFERRGIATREDPKEVLPADCAYRLEYEARWKWDIALYLAYADLRLYEGQLQVGRATYNARDADYRLDKFGSGSGKVTKLMTGCYGTSPAQTPVHRAPCRTGEDRQRSDRRFSGGAPAPSVASAAWAPSQERV